MSEAKKPCCTPPRGESAPNAAPPQLRRARRVAENAVHIPGGQAIIGTNTPRIPNDGESPMRKTRLDGFLIGATTVTNAEFAAFVADTGYVTEAERFGWSFV
ncbi:MAG: SUMF1/EgtB/PvdO family nonheme iron enzyme, partial [Pseudomonadota bacterium]